MCLYILSVLYFLNRRSHAHPLSNGAPSKVNFLWLSRIRWREKRVSYSLAKKKRKGKKRKKEWKKNINWRIAKKNRTWKRNTGKSQAFYLPYKRVTLNGEFWYYISTVVSCNNSVTSSPKIQYLPYHLGRLASIPFAV